jgi:hypothetical protein
MTSMGQAGFLLSLPLLSVQLTVTVWHNCCGAAPVNLEHRLLKLLCGMRYGTCQECRTDRTTV